MIVTTGAGDGQAEESFGNDINAIIDDVVLHPHEALAQSQETERRQIGGIFGGGG